MDASNMLKPQLARGDLHCVGATTTTEYRKVSFICFATFSPLVPPFSPFVLPPPSQTKMYQRSTLKRMQL